MAKKKYYAVRQGRKTGIYQTWGECKEQVQGYKNSIFKSFSTSYRKTTTIGPLLIQTLEKKCHYIQRLSQNLSHTLMEVITMVHILMAA